jgi:hypothetical protein
MKQFFDALVFSYGFLSEIILLMNLKALWWELLLQFLDFLKDFLKGLAHFLTQMSSTLINATEIIGVFG